ncbi:hypothetical protein [Pseudomonas phage GP100]|nr:hypothetical protein [Pseudomonas phage GP100]
MSHCNWAPPELSTGRSDEENALLILKSLPEHILSAIPLVVMTESGQLTVLSIYIDDDGEDLVIDVEKRS